MALYNVTITGLGPSYTISIDGDLPIVVGKGAIVNHLPPAKYIIGSTNFNFPNPLGPDFSVNLLVAAANDNTPPAGYQFVTTGNGANYVTLNNGADRVLVKV